MPNLQSHLKPQRFPALDGVRGLAVLMVLVWHYVTCQVVNDAGGWAPCFRRILCMTGSGVELFFALSGFLIVGILLDQKGGRNYFRVFYLRRVCRIFPLYFLLLGLFVVVSGWRVLPEEASQWLFGESLPLWSYATFTQNLFMGLEGRFGPNWLGVTWSLAVEEQFYLMVPLLVCLLDRRVLGAVIVAAFVALPMLRMGSPGFHGFVNLPWRADPLLTGACVALMVRSARVVEVVMRLRRWVLGTGVLLVAVVGVMILIPGSLGVFGNTVFGLLYGMLILIVRLDLCRGVGRLLETRTLCWMGQISYGIYMFHQAVSGLMHGLIKGQIPRIAGVSDAVITLASVIITLVLAWLSYRFLESPILRFGHRFHYSNNRNPCRSN